VGDIVLSGNSYNLDFITSLLPSSVTSVVRMPQDMTLDSHVKINGSRYNTTFYVKEGVGQISGKAFVDTKSMTYDAQVKAHQLQLQRLMPSLGLQPFSGNLAFKGSGTDVFSPKTRLDLSAAIEQFAYNHYKLNNVKANATVIGPNLPINIVIIIKSLEIMPNSAVIPRLKPVVEKADTTSYITLSVVKLSIDNLGKVNYPKK